jgi:L-aspartate oxidase
VQVTKTDIIVIGSGAAGLFFSIKAARFADVLVITKKESYQSNTNYAQGGIATVIDEHDSFEGHIADTLAAGRGLSNPEAVEIMVREGPDRIRELIEMGVRFNRNKKNGSLELGREGGHSAPRIVHYGDITGRELEMTLVSEVTSQRRIRIRENCLAIDLVTGGDGRVLGCSVLDRGTNSIELLLARYTVLATGGAGKIYLYTSNPDIATGDGIAMAFTAGARIANLEFVQFHPTCLYHPRAKTQLISEALRGEGAVLRNVRGDEFMEQYDHRKELAPRDVVARAIDSEMKSTGEKHVFLDITHRSRNWLRRRFPHVFEMCQEFGIDISRDPIPVVPAAHYMCGGVRIDIDGRTDLPGLLAIGEVACAGIHGANRLASNSLLEAVVVADRCARYVRRNPGRKPARRGLRTAVPPVGDPEELQTVILDHDWDLTRRIMWDYVGIVRSEKRLRLARERLRQIQKTVDRLYGDYGVSADLVELRNIALISSLVVASALQRRESRGLHYMLEYPRQDPSLERETILHFKRGVR